MPIRTYQFSSPKRNGLTTWTIPPFEALSDTTIVVLCTSRAIWSSAKMSSSVGIRDTGTFVHYGSWRRLRRSERWKSFRAPNTAVAPAKVNQGWTRVGRDCCIHEYPNSSCAFSFFLRFLLVIHHLAICFSVVLFIRKGFLGHVSHHVSVHTLRCGCECRCNP